MTTTHPRRTEPAADQFAPAERAAWRSFTAVLNRLPAVLDAHMTSAVGLTHFEYRVLEALAGYPGNRMQLSVLACATSASLSRLSHVVDRLEHAGFVERQRIPGTVARQAVLTRAGAGKAAAARIAYRDAVGRLVFDGSCGKDVAALGRLMAEIEAKIAAHAAPARKVGR